MNWFFCAFIKVICISPTYELALQTGQVAEKMGKFCPEVKIGYAVKGERGEKLEPEKYGQNIGLRSP